MTSSPVRYPSGVTSRRHPHPLAHFPRAIAGIVGDPEYISVFDDFHDFVGSGSGVTGWHLDESGTATGAAVQATMAGGVILAVPGSSAGNNFQYQYADNTTVALPFAASAAKKPELLAARFKTEDADQNLVRIMMQNAQDDPWATATTDSFGFRSNASTPSTLEFIVGPTVAAQQTLTIGTVADDTWYNLFAVYDGNHLVHAAAYTDDGTRLGGGQIDVATASSAAGNMPNAARTLAFGMENVDTGADDFHLDFILGAQRRVSG